MFNTIAIEVVIGLVFVYLLYSLLATILQEILSTYFSFRAKNLERAIIRMLEDDNAKTSAHNVFYLFKKNANCIGGSSFSHQFYSHPLIKYLGESNKNNKPSYLNKETFSKVIIDLLRGDKIQIGDDIKNLIQNTLNSKSIKDNKIDLGEETVSYINSIWIDSQGDIEKFKGLLEEWFDATMERASGWYKKNTQKMLFSIGLFIAISFNVDSLKIANNLATDPKLREQIVKQAETYLEANPDLEKNIMSLKAKEANSQPNMSASVEITRGTSIHITDSAAQTRKTEVSKIKADSLDLIRYQQIKARADSLLRNVDSLMNGDLSKLNSAIGLGWSQENADDFTVGNIFLMLAGWLLTALAISLGAPFWFDLLNKLMKLRSSLPTISGNKTKTFRNNQEPNKRVG